MFRESVSKSSPGGGYLELTVWSLSPIYFPGLVRSRDGSHLSPNTQPYISLPSPNIQSAKVRREDEIHCQKLILGKLSKVSPCHCVLFAAKKLTCKLGFPLRHRLHSTYSLGGNPLDCCFETSFDRTLLYVHMCFCTQPGLPYTKSPSSLLTQPTVPSISTSSHPHHHCDDLGDARTPDTTHLVRRGALVPPKMDGIIDDGPGDSNRSAAANEGANAMAAASTASQAATATSSSSASEDPR